MTDDLILLTRCLIQWRLWHLKHENKNWCVLIILLIEKSKHLRDLRWVVARTTHIFFRIYMYFNFIRDKDNMYAVLITVIYRSYFYLEQVRDYSYLFILLYSYFWCNCIKYRINYNTIRHWSIFDCAKVELLQVYFRQTLNILHLKTDIIQRSILINNDIKTYFRLILRNEHCAQLVLILTAF